MIRVIVFGIILLSLIFIEVDLGRIADAMDRAYPKPPEVMEFPLPPDTTIHKISKSFGGP